MTIVLFLLLAFQQPPATTTQPPPAATTQPPPAAPRPAAPTPPRRPTATNGTMEIRVLDRSGSPATGAHVSATGPTMRDGTADANGIVTLRTMPPGVYRVRAEGDGFVPFEKEITIKGGPALSVEFSLSAAPRPPAPEPKPEPPPPPPAAPAPPAGVPPGEPRAISIPDLAERSLAGKDPVRIFPIGCSGLSASRLIVLRDAIPPTATSDADETIYLVAGEATMTLGGKEITFTPGWFGIVPRGTKAGLTRKGRNPAILLSTLNGRPCGGASGSGQ